MAPLSFESRNSVLLCAVLSLSACLAVPAPPDDNSNGASNGGDGDGDGDGDEGGDEPLPDAGPRPDGSTSGGEAVELTQSTSKTIRDNHSISCTDEQGHHGETSFYRAFDLETMLPGKGIRVEKVEVGIETANDSNGQGQPLIVRLHKLTSPPIGNTILEASLTQVGIQTSTVNDTEQSIHTVLIDGEVSSGETLVVEVFFPDGHLGGNEHEMVVGSNSSGQSGKTYIKDECGPSQPTDVATVANGDFADTHLVLSVHGTSR